MGQLEPGAKYVYEHSNGVTYARKFGDPHNKRFEIGRTLKRQELDKQMEESALWTEIFRAAEQNEALQNAIDNVKIIYYMTKKDE